MCGIAGFANLDGAPAPIDVLARMVERIRHRGPDDEGVLADGAVAIGNRRLAVIDPSAAGHQPLRNEDGSIAVTFNGAIYNFRELRGELERAGHVFRSHTDTEVIVHAYEQWGQSCVERFDGMFAFALWDRGAQRLLLARDRFGVKPLYWARVGDVVVFGSEIKSMLEHPVLRAELSFEALDEYLSFQNVFSDRTLFRGVRLLPPATTLAVDLRSGDLRAARYWDYPVPDAPGSAGEEEYAERLAELFQRAVVRQLVADVPLGSYLSGGLDSGSIVAVAARHMPRLLTFTGGFDMSSAQGLELGFDERSAAEDIANRFKTEHYEVVLHAGDMEWVLPELVWHLEDLRVGQSYPNYYAARLASRFVKVVLSGAGGDELFGGYPWRYYRGVESSGRDDYLERYYGFWQRLTTDDEKAELLGAPVRAAVGEHSTRDVFRSVFDDWGGGYDGPEDFIGASLYLELKTFLHGLLVVEDKLSMAHSLETRVPFLDNELVDFAARMPVRFKLRYDGVYSRIDENVTGKRRVYEESSADGKAVLRRAMHRFVPEQALARKKQGFSAPDASWFRGESIDYINRLLRDPDARIYEFLRPEGVARVLDEHTSGAHNRRLLIWSLLNLEWWCRCFLDGLSPSELDLRRLP
jgi:asparagine synthase (glutamine-hydrolysing)